MDSDHNRIDVEEIVGGQDAPSPIPWQVSIGKLGFGHWCGGTILDEKTVLSAAHCFDVCQKSWDGWYVMAGATDKNGSGGQVRFFQFFKISELNFVISDCFHCQWSLEHGHAL